MILHTVEQGSPEWLQLRAGVVTASEIDGVMTPATRKASKSRTYFRRIVAERIIGEPVMTQAESKFMERGKAIEPEARAWYDAQFGYERGGVTVAGFVTTDDRKLGASPDALVGADGGLEIKVPNLETHVGYMLDPSELVADYIGQPQVGMIVTGRAWWDLMSFCPHPSIPNTPSEDFPPVIVRLVPDVAYRDALAVALADFEDRVAEAVAKIRAAKVEIDPASFHPFL